MNKDLGFQSLEGKIYTIRGLRVMLDRDLAKLYGVTTGNLNKAVKRNIKRFPSDFMFRMNTEEFQNWVFQNGRSNSEKMGLRTAPYVFTEYGVAALSGILRSDIAIKVNIEIVRVFIALRRRSAMNSEFIQLKEQVQRLESDIKVDKAITDKKVTSLSQSVQRLNTLFDEFQDQNIIIKRPEN